MLYEEYRATHALEAVTYVTFVLMNPGHSGEPVKLLARCSLFAALPTEEVERICSRINIGIHRYEPGAVIKLRGERYEDLLIVGRGEIVASIEDLSGKTLRVEALPAPSIVASAVFFAEHNLLPVTISASRETMLFSLSRKSVLWIARNYEECLSSLLADMGNRVVFLAEKLRMAQFATIEQKLAVFLLEQMQRQGSREVRIHHTKQQLSEIFGVTRPALSRVFATLCEEGLFEYGQSWVRITDEEGLKAILFDFD